MTEKFTLYSSLASQWASVPKLGLAEKGYSKEDYEVKELNILTAENFDPAYVAINPNATVPSLTSPSLREPLVDSRTVLQHIDAGRPSAPTLVPTDNAAKERMSAIIELIHAPKMSTNLILLQARDGDEMQSKRTSMWNGFVNARQQRLEAEHKANPDHVFYGPKAAENGAMATLYSGSDIGGAHEKFFAETHDAYAELAKGLEELNELLVLPFAVGQEVSEADLHVVPWMAHAMWGAGTEPSNVLDFGPLEELVRKSVPEFRIGHKTKEWWSNFSKRESFKEIFPVLH